MAENMQDDDYRKVCTHCIMLAKLSVMAFISRTGILNYDACVVNHILFYVGIQILQGLPRFQTGNLEHNNILFERLKGIAARKGCSPSQLALAWVHHQGDDVCPIPGTTKIENLDNNIDALSIKLTPEEIAELESIASGDAVKGGRFQGASLTWKASETPPLDSWKA